MYCSPWEVWLVTCTKVIKDVRRQEISSQNILIALSRTLVLTLSMVSGDEGHPHCCSRELQNVNKNKNDTLTYVCLLRRDGQVSVLDLGLNIVGGVQRWGAHCGSLSWILVMTLSGWGVAIPVAKKFRCFQSGSKGRSSLRCGNVWEPRERNSSAAEGHYLSPHLLKWETRK